VLLLHAKTGGESEREASWAFIGGGERRREQARRRGRRRGWGTPAAPSCRSTSSASPSAARSVRPFHPVSSKPVLSVPLAAIWLLGLGSRSQAVSVSSGGICSILRRRCCCLAAQPISAAAAAVISFRFLLLLGLLWCGVQTRGGHSARIGGSNRKRLLSVSVSPCSGIPRR
jgi:hypothetical protein